MKSIPDIEVENEPGSSNAGGAGGVKVWTITGRVRVRESEIDGDSHDRPLKGIEVKVSASDIGADGPWTEWGTVRTDADGDFALSESNNGRTRFFRVQATITDTSFNGIPRIYLHQGQPDDDWYPDFALQQFMLMWHDLHTEGSRKISGYPSAAFAHGFSLFASNALFHELWATRLAKPLNRRAVAAGLALSTLDEIEGSEPGVENALRLLRYGERKGWWSHLFGTAQSYPDNRPDDDGDGEVDIGSSTYATLTSLSVATRLPEELRRSR
jgi:hypothetical protein